MIKTVSVIGLAVAATVCLFIFSQLDQELSEESANLISRIEAGEKSESYIYLLGINTAKDENPSLAGRHLFEELQKKEADHAYIETEYTGSKKLTLPSGNAFCKTWEKNCLETMFHESDQADNLMIEHDVLVSRSARFLEFNQYRTLTKPTIYEVFSPYKYIAAAERIKLLSAISTYKNGEPTKAISALTVQFSKLRASMELQDNLIGKLIFLMKLSEVIDVLSIIHSNEDLQAEMVPRLSASEKSFYMISAREFGLAYHTFKNLDKHPEFFEIGARTPGWKTRIFFKPNMTINALAPTYTRLEELAQLSPSGFAKRMGNQENNNVSTSVFRNYAGKALISFLTSDGFDHYPARFSDLDTKISLFNQIHHFKRDTSHITNPYYGREVPEKTDGKLCLSGPLEDERSLRCLAMELMPFQ